MKPDPSHNTFHLILELLVLIGLSKKLSVEDRVHEDLVPADSIAFIDLQASLQEVHSLGRKILSFYLQRRILDVVDQLVLSGSCPGSVPMQHLVKDEAQGPNITFGAIA